MTKGSKMLKRTEAASLRKERMTWKRQFCKGTNFAKTKKYNNFVYLDADVWTHAVGIPPKETFGKGKDTWRS